MFSIKHLLAGASLCALPFGAMATQIYGTQLSELNDSGVSGNATLAYDQGAGTLNVAIQASGLEPGKPHAQHIHGLPGGDSQSPTAADDADGDGFVELAEAAPNYGPIIVPLTSPPGQGATTAAGFPTAPDGTIDFSQTYDLSDPVTFTQGSGFDSSDLFPLENREIVLHGMSVSSEFGAGTDGEVDGTSGYKVVLPVATGEITAQNVPAPATWPMLAFGFSLIGGLLLARGSKPFRNQ